MRQENTNKNPRKNPEQIHKEWHDLIEATTDFSFAEKWLIHTIRTKLQYGVLTVTIRDGLPVAIERITERWQPPIIHRRDDLTL